MSYDEPKTLAAFAKKRDIAYPLLADAGSRTIDAWNVRNEEARGTQMDGIPRPGIALVDARGIIRAKLFHDGYKTRPAPGAIIDAAKAIEHAAE